MYIAQAYSQKKHAMKTTPFLYSLLLMVMAVCCQTNETNLDLNLDFEQIKEQKPVKWNNFGSHDYLVSLDSISKKRGKYAAVIEYEKGESDFKALSLTLPHNYEGSKITLSGYIKTENVTDGYAGLWMRIDPSIAFDNMYQQGVKGTTDWQKYEITLNMIPDETKLIVVGGMLTGKGKMWLDDLKITIDGKDISKLKPYEQKLLPAEQDREFDLGSKILIPDPDENQIVNLELLGKIWGFLKYHHPEVGKGNYNWDYELFRMLPGYIAVTDHAQRDKVLLEWIKKYGKVPEEKTNKKVTFDAYIKPDISWIDASDMNAELKEMLHHIYSNRYQGHHFYIRMALGVGNPVFRHEKAYANPSYPDSAFRLLSLYKYWNMVYYFFPNTYITDKDWNSVLKEYIPLFIQAKDELEYELATVQLIGEVNDTHANLWNGADKIYQWKGIYYPPFHTRFIEGKLVVTDYYNSELEETAGLKIGDVITHINGKTIEDLIKNIKKYYPASNEAARLRDISVDILRSNDQTIRLQYIASGQSKQKDLKLYPRNDLKIFHWYKNSTDKSYKLLDENIGYITLATIKDEDIPAIKDTFNKTKGIIIDIRNYPATFVPFSLGSYFVSAPSPFVKFTTGNSINPGEFVFTPPIEIQPADKTYQGKLVVLVNELTQSQAEYTSMAFRAGRNTTIIGSTTAGADGNVSSIMLPGGLQTMISGIGVYYPDGTPTQRVGIVPDIVVEPTIKGIRNKKDELLEKAIEIINKQ